MCLLEYVEGAVINNGCCQAQLKFFAALLCLKDYGSVQHDISYFGNKTSNRFAPCLHLKHNMFSIIVVEPTNKF